MPKPMNARAISVDERRFGGIGRLYGKRALERLARARVAVVGVGGVGSWTVEALVRSGVGTVALIDLDDVCLTNTNRQLPALEETVGRPKVEVLAERMRRIHPGAEIRPIAQFFLESTAEALLEPGYDWVIDAVDRMSVKALIIARCRERGYGVLTLGGAGGRRDPTQVRCADLAVSGGDALLRQVRRRLRETHGWNGGRNGEPWGVPAVFSAERQVFPGSDGEVCTTPEPGENLRMDCASGYGAASFVTGAFGFAAAAEVVRRLVEPGAE